MPTVLITGANRGLGLEFVRQYSEKNWNVIATCRNPQQARDLNNLGRNINIKPLDVRDLDSITRCADELNSIPIDILILNAGVFPQKGATLAETDFNLWADGFETNAVSAAKLALCFKENILKSKQKKIIALSSKAGSMTENKTGGNFIYRSSKSALNSIVVGLAEEFRSEGITCVAIIPGMTQTDMGGSKAPRTTTISVKDMRSVISTLTEKESGLFLDYDGNEIAW